MAQIEMRISANDKTAKGTIETATDSDQEIADAAQALFMQLAQELNPQAVQQGQA